MKIWKSMNQNQVNNVYLGNISNLLSKELFLAQNTDKQIYSIKCKYRNRYKIIFSLKS